MSAGKVIVYTSRDHSEFEVHAEYSAANYVTLCGLDGDDPSCDQFGYKATNKKINCPHCIETIKHAKRYRV